MSEVMTLILEDEDLIELMRVLLDDDADGALAWLKVHLSGKAPTCSRAGLDRLQPAL